MIIESHEAAIILNGELYHYNYDNNIQAPDLLAILSKSNIFHLPSLAPGDIIGNPKLDNGHSRSLHSWIVSYEPCDYVTIPNDYLDVSNLVA